MAKFNQMKALDYYYMSGYKIMNPLCRILLDTPGHKVVLENGVDGDVGTNVTRVTTVDLKKQSGKAWDVMSIDEAAFKTIITGDATHERKAYIDSGVSEQDLQGVDFFKTATYTSVRERLSSLWEYCKEAKNQLQNETPATCTWVIRGVGARSIKRLAEQGARFTPAVPSWIRFNKTYYTNQFFSTTDGNEISSIAQSSLVWLVRLKREGTQGRIGGQYTSEKEVLFPFGTGLRLEGGVAVNKHEQIAKCTIDSLPNSDEVRKKVDEVYLANSDTFKNRTQYFLIATEA